MVKKLLEHFMKKDCSNTNQKEFRIEKWLRKKGDKLYVKRKGYITHLIAGLIKTI